MNDPDKYYVKVDGQWRHRSPLKCILNPVLRTIQFWRQEPYVIATVTDFVDGQPHFVKYQVARIKYLKRP